MNASGQPAGDREAEVAASRSMPPHANALEAELMAELAGSTDGSFAGNEETFRLLIGVLLRDRTELEQLRDHTVSALAAYDAEHDTELVATLQTFLALDGSTTDTAEAMNLHRHTVGYRLSRTQAVSGLSPYETDGRERLSLGLKAQQILEAEARWAARHLLTSHPIGRREPWPSKRSIREE